MFMLQYKLNICVEGLISYNLDIFFEKLIIKQYRVYNDCRQNKI